MTTTTVREAARTVLRSRGLTTIFGNPGSTELAFLQDFPEDFRYVLGLQESAVVAMADGYAQASGTAALVSLHSACGLGNAMGAIVNAYHNKAPLLILSGQQDRRHLALEPYLYARSVELARPYVKWSHEPTRAADVPAALARAYTTAMQPPRGPVFISVPANDWDEVADSVPESQQITTRTGPDPAAVRRVATLLRGSRRPVIIVGAGVDASGAWEPATLLAQALSAPVWAAPQAPRAGFQEDHPLFRGHLPASREPMARCLAGHDLALLLGAPAFTYLIYTEGVTPLPPFAHVSDDPDEIARAASAVGVLGDIRLTTQCLLTELPPLPRRLQPPPRPQPAREPPNTPIQPGYLMQELAAVLPDDAILVEESPSNRAEMRQHIRISQPHGFYASASGGLGFALPAAVGITLARPEHPVVCLAGDGSAMYACQALWTAARQGVHVLFVIANNARYAILEDLAADAGRKDIPGTLLPGIDYVGLATSMGCPAQRVKKACDLPQALRNGLDHSVFLVEVMLATQRGAGRATTANPAHPQTCLRGLRLPKQIQSASGEV